MVLSKGQELNGVEFLCEACLNLSMFRPQDMSKFSKDYQRATQPAPN